MSYHTLELKHVFMFNLHYQNWYSLVHFSFLKKENLCSRQPIFLHPMMLEYHVLPKEMQECILLFQCSSAIITTAELLLQLTSIL